MDSVNRCPSCRAPNPKGRTACWSCQAPVTVAPAPARASAVATTDAPAANPWGMEAYRHTCTGCGSVHGILNRACPKCGTPTAGPLPVNSSPLPYGWEASPTASGATRLHLTPAARLNIGGGAAMVFVLPALLTGLLLWDASHRTIRGGTPVWIAVVIQLLIMAAFLYFQRELLPTAVYSLLGGEEWIARPGSLEIRRYLFGRSSQLAFDSGVLYLSAHWIYTGRSRHALARLRLDVGGRKRTLYAQLGRDGIDQLEALGGALARLTGWQFHVEPRAADLKKPWYWL